MRRLFIALVFSTIAPTAFCQVDTAWVRRYNGPGDSTDQVTAMAIDDSGNVYVTGFSLGTGGGYDFDYATIKYDRNGNLLWEQRFNGSGNGADHAYNIALDKNGNAYVTGASVGPGTDFDFATIKYDPQGNQLWVTRYNGPVSRGDGGNALIVDKESNVYVTGKSEGGNPPGFCGKDFDLTTIKYDSHGNQLWVVRKNGPANSDDGAAKIALDTNGNVFVGGYICTGQFFSHDFVIIKYDSSGNQLWVQSYGQEDYDDVVSDLRLDSRGDLYVTGWSGANGTNHDFATIKYDAQGNPLWISRFNGVAYNDDYPMALVLDGKGNAVVTGHSYNPISKNTDIVTIKFDSNGNQLWVQNYDGPVGGTDAGWDAAFDSIGNFYVGGGSTGNGSSRDYLILKYDSAGNLLGEIRYDGVQHSFDEAEAIRLDPSGNIYVVGRSIGSTKPDDYDYTTIKYSPLPTLKGDLNLDGVLTMADVVLMLNLVFYSKIPPAAPSAGDLNCDGLLSASDVVILLQIFFLSVSAPC